MRLNRLPRQLSPRFSPASPAIVTNVGAPLSHTAIVAREMGIPAVIDSSNSTMLLKTGDHVRVDGARGIIEILTG
jgi:pyruvate,water dikinase